MRGPGHFGVDCAVNLAVRGRTSSYCSATYVRPCGCAPSAGRADRLDGAALQASADGSGLGLSIARTIVDRVGGRITMSDGPDGRGATVDVAF